MILTSFFSALGQIGDPRFRGVLWRGIGLTLLLLIALAAGFVSIINVLVGDSATLPLIGEVTWLNNALSWGSVFLVLGLSIFLMVPVASAITSLFLEEVAQAVEDKHYSNLPPSTPVPLSDGLRDTVNFLGLMLLANICALVLYVMFPPFSPFIFWGLNGFLLGREYFTLAAMRRVGRTNAKALRRQNMTTIWLAGTLMAIPLSIPLLNLIIPILGAATFTHLFHHIVGDQAKARLHAD